MLEGRENGGTVEERPTERPVGGFARSGVGGGALMEAASPSESLSESGDVGEVGEASEVGDEGGAVEWSQAKKSMHMADPAAEVGGRADDGKCLKRNRERDDAGEGAPMDWSHAKKSFRTMNMAELRSEVAGHGDDGKYLKRKRKLDYVELLESVGRAKYVCRENESITCGLNDELWGLVANKLQKTDLKALARLGKTCRQLRRVVHKSGLWASLVTVLVNGTKVADDNRSAVLKNGFQLSYDVCEETVEAIELMLPSVCFNALINMGRTPPPEKDVMATDDYHKRGILRLEPDNLQYIFSLRRSDLRLIQGASLTTTPGLRNWTTHNAIPAQLLLEIAFRKVSSAHCIQNLRRKVLQRREQFTQRCKEFEAMARSRKLALPIKELHRAQKSFAARKKTLEECLETLRRDQQEILVSNREEQVQQALHKYNIQVSPMSTCCNEFIQSKTPQCTLDELVDQVRETAFFYRYTGYSTFRTSKLDILGGGPLGSIIEMCLDVSAEKIAEELSQAHQQNVFDDQIDWTPVGRKLKQTALCFYVRATLADPLDEQVVPPSLRAEALSMRASMKALETTVGIDLARIYDRRLLQWVIENTLQPEAREPPLPSQSSRAKKAAGRGTWHALPGVGAMSHLDRLCTPFAEPAVFA